MPKTMTRAQELQEIIDAERERIFGHAKQRFDDDGKVIVDTMTCGTCGMSWNDALSTSYTPTPSARCPFEYVHGEVAELKRLQRRRR